MMKAVSKMSTGFFVAKSALRAKAVIIRDATVLKNRKLVVGNEFRDQGLNCGGSVNKEVK